LPQDHNEQLRFAKIETTFAATRRTLGDEAVPLAAHQRQPHVRSYNVEVGLDLPFAQMKLVSKLASAFARRFSDVLNDVPDSPETIRYQPLSFHQATLGTSPKGRILGQKDRPS
jgi:hypothetical protein